MKKKKASSDKAVSSVSGFDSWTDFPVEEEILRALESNGLEKPLPIQIRSLKATLLHDKHVLGAARTGSGKTLAYAIPTLNRILVSTDNPASNLKRKICTINKKKQDFDIIDTDHVSIEDMIQDHDINGESSDNISSDEQEESDAESVDEDPHCYTCPEALVLVPTRELASQVKSQFDIISKNTNVKSTCLIGGLNQDKQLRILKKVRPQIIIATPGRLYDIAQSGSSEHLNIESIASIRTLVIDEADRMVQRGHFEELKRIIDTIKESKQFRGDEFPVRVYLFSATLTFLHELPERFKTVHLDSKESRSSGKKGKAKIIDTKQHNKKNKIRQMLALLGLERADTRIIDLNDESSFGRPSSEQLKEFKINCTQNEKDLYLYYFLVQNTNKRTLIFCNSKDCLRRLANVLKFLKVDVLKLHADMDQKKRLLSLERLRERSSSVAVATDVAARGLDINDLDCVVHYQVPKTCESYIHRSGRTARLSKEGISLTLCEPKEVPFYRRLCNSINGGDDLKDYNVDPNLKKLLKGRVALAQQCDKLDHQLRERKSHSSWFEKAAKECDIELDDDELRHLSGRGKSQQENLEYDADKKRRLSYFQKQLNTLLKRPLVTRQIVMKKMAEKLKSSGSSAGETGST